MSAAILLAVANILQLILTLALSTKKAIGKIDSAIFYGKLSEYSDYRVSEFFKDSHDGGNQSAQGVERTNAVLGRAQLTIATRSAIVGLAIAGIGILITAGIIVAQCAALWRLGLNLLGFATVSFFLMSLWIRTVRGELETTPAKSKYFENVLDRQLITQYISVAFLGNVIIIVSATGL